MTARALYVLGTLPGRVYKKKCVTWGLGEGARIPQGYKLRGRAAGGAEGLFAGEFRLHFRCCGL